MEPILKVLAVIGAPAIMTALSIFIVNLGELFKRVETLESMIKRMEDFHGTTD